MTAEQVNELTLKFNSFPSYPQSVFLVTRDFAQQVDSYTHYERVVLLDALFNTKLRQTQPIVNGRRKTIFEISVEIRDSLYLLDQIVAPLGDSTLFSLQLTNQQIKDCIASALQTILYSLNNNSLSFTGKYLHFYNPKVFPLWDKFVPQSINDIYDDEIFQENNPNTVDNYILLCQKYQELAAQFTIEQINQMQQHDHNSQPESWKIESTFVRILDKALWSYQKFQ